ncbi:MAG: N-acetylneuraminate synthase family protein [Candidatus Pseudothioglobus sp.]
MNKSMQLGKREITRNSRPYVIAEIGVNHNGSFDQAIKLINLAKLGGADAAKFQSYKANSIASKNSPAYWDIQKESSLSQYDLFKKYDSFNSKQYEDLARHCKKVDIDFLSTPFDDDSIEFLDPIMSFYKIASADITNLPFLRKIAIKNKPIVLSTGASSLAEINLAIETLYDYGAKDVALLHCILNYPTENRNANLGMICALKDAYPENLIGYSDHTLPCKSMVSLVTAVQLGAVIIEKHFTHDKTLPGNDHYHAMDVNDLKCFFSKLEHIDVLKGSIGEKRPISSESISRLNARRSLVISKKIESGEILTEDNLTYKRPGNGISPLKWDNVIGMRVKKDLEIDHILQWGDLK